MPTALPTPPVVVVQARCLRHRVDASTRHPRLGAAGIPEAAGAFTCVNLFCSSDLDFPPVPTVDIRKRQNGSGRASRKRVDPSRVAREGEIRAADATGAASVARPGFVRRLFGRGLRPEVLLSRQTRSKVGDGIRRGQWAAVVTVKDV
jgi:hypothetical protein